MALKALTAEALIAALSTIPERTGSLHCTLVKNPVGNLAIFDEFGLYIGYVDLQTGEVDINDGSGR